MRSLFSTLPADSGIGLQTRLQGNVGGACRAGHALWVWIRRIKGERFRVNEFAGLQDLTPASKAAKQIKQRVTELTTRNQTWRPLGDIVREVNQALRGWVGYFHYRNCSTVLAQVKRHAEERLRTHLRKRHKIKDRGMGLHRFPNRVLYADYGLYKVPTSAGWTSAHASV
jgi:hypothetical protein